jgi:hypothetical protein
MLLLPFPILQKFETIMLHSEGKSVNERFAGQIWDRPFDKLRAILSATRADKIGFVWVRFEEFIVLSLWLLVIV